ncbi:MAG: S8 family serine peptidase [Micromonosporaceae bacterium]|nr:S8 family serine peptidase [Micromonosporaceae bacterium]
MRTRTTAFWLAAIVVAGLGAVAPSAYHATVSWAGIQEAPSDAGNGPAAADGTKPLAGQVIDACPDVAPPRVSCFARYAVGTVQPMAGETPEGWGPADLRSAYNLPSSGGANQLVAIIDAYSNPNAEADLAAYREQYGLPPCTTASGCLTIVNQDGEASPLPEPEAGWALEIALDLDMVSAACPQCKLLLVEADSNDLDDLGTAVETAVRMGADVLSNSYGTSVEFAEEVNYEHYYNQPGHAIVVSAGDLGYSVSFPAVARYVTAVGGTSLKRGTDGTWSESVWSGTGSGCSAYIPKPAWQTDEHCPMRMVTDVAAVADPATGVAVLNTYGGGGWTIVGGTSAAAPIIAAVYALAGTASKVNDGRTPWKNGRTAGLFRDVTTGQNVPSAFAVTCGGDYLCTGAVGYDGPTGWGTPLGVKGLTAS